MIFLRYTTFWLAKPKKAGLAGQNIAHLKKIILRCVGHIEHCLSFQLEPAVITGLGLTF